MFAVAAASTSGASKTRTLLNSGTTDYCFQDRNHFTEYTKAGGREGEVAIKNSRFSIEGQGLVTRKYTVGGKMITLCFKDAIHTPQLASNLVSVGRLCDAGFQVNFDQKKVLVYNDNRDGFTCIGEDGLYGFDEAKLTKSTTQTLKPSH